MSFRFLHTADWQLGKPFGNIPGDAGAALRAQRLATVERIARFASERQVDAVLVAGDAFDSNEVEDRTIHKMLEALKPFSGPWIFLPGNHDAGLPHSVWSRLRQFQPSPNVMIADRPEPILGWDGRAAILPAPLRRRREALDQTEWFDTAETPDGAIRIGLAHGSVAGRLPAAAEANNAIPETRAETARLDYLALGDWHGTLKIAPRTWYAGTPETDRHRANQSGFALLVEIDAPGAPERVKPLQTGTYQWRQLEAEIADGSAEAVLALMTNLPAETSRVVLSLTVRGSIGLAERHRLQAGLTQWGNRLHHFDLDDTGLLDDPTPDDLDALDTSGFVRLAIERLKAMAEDPVNADAASARVALRMIYLDHMQAEH